jgi:hypothetical protein
LTQFDLLDKIFGLNLRKNVNTKKVAYGTSFGAMQQFSISIKWFF